MKLNLLEARQIELLYLIYVHAGGIGNSTYPINLKDICTVDDGNALWFIAAEDLAHESWIELSGSQLDDAVALMTPAGRKQVRKWEKEYDLDQRLVSIQPDGAEWQTDKPRYWVNFAPIQFSPAVTSGGEPTLDNLKIGYVLYDGNVKDALRYIRLRTDGSHDIYISNVEEHERGADVTLSSERQRWENDHPDTKDPEREIPGKWPVSSVRVIYGVGSIGIARLTKRRTQVSFVAMTEDCAQYADSLIEKMRNERVIVDTSTPTAENPPTVNQLQKHPAGDFSNNEGFKLSGKRILNEVERVKFPGLDDDAFQQHMQELGKVGNIWPRRYSYGDRRGLINETIGLVGFFAKDVANAYANELTIGDGITAIERVLSGFEGLRFAPEKGETYRKYWLLDENGQRAAYVEAYGPDELTWKRGGGLSQALSTDSDKEERETWYRNLEVILISIEHLLIARAAQLVMNEQWAAENTPTAIEGDAVMPSASNRVKSFEVPRNSESGHYAMSYDGRKNLVEKFRKDRAAGKVENIEAWASTNGSISGRTLRNYFKEFPAET